MSTYRDILRLKALESQLSGQDIHRPELPLVSHIQSPDDFVGYEHYIEFNNEVVDTLVARTSVAFKEVIGAKGVSAYSLDDGRRFNASYAKPLNLNDFHRLTEIISDSIESTAKEGVVRRLDTPLGAFDDLDILPIAHTAPSAEITAAAQFAVRAGMLISLYSDSFATQDETKRGQAVYFNSALAMQIQTQIK